MRSNIVEGYGRRIYKQEFIRFIIFAIGSNDETIDHLETLFETGSLTNQELYEDLKNNISLLGKKLHTFLEAVQRNHQTERKE